MLDEATLTFNSSSQEVTTIDKETGIFHGFRGRCNSFLIAIMFQGMRYLFDHGLVSNNASEIASFFHHSRAKLSKTQIRNYLQVSLSFKALANAPSLATEKCLGLKIQVHAAFFPSRIGRML